MDSFNSEVCDQCGKSYSCKGTLARHKKLHDGVKPYRCNVCDKAFLRKDKMIQHMKIHERVQKRLSVCQLCGESFTTKKLLFRHRRVHVLMKEHQCSICNQVLMKKSLLNLHEKEHKIAREYKCHMCNSVFKTRLMFNLHKKEHKIPREYKCHMCNSVFKTRLMFNLHGKEHKISKEYKCDICKSVFKTKFLFHQHKKQHETPKSFNCEECSETFDSKVNLLNHKKVSHYVCIVKKTHDDGNHVCVRLNPAKSALNMFFTYIVNPSVEVEFDFIPFFEEARPKLKCTLLYNICEKGALKWYCIVKTLCSRKSVGEETEYANPFFRSNCVGEYTEENVDQHISEAFSKITNSFENFNERGSG